MATPVHPNLDRLARLRQYDTTGFYLSDEPAEGSDDSGCLTVVVDPTNRVIGVRVNGSADAVRTPTKLSAAFDEAVGRARYERYLAGAGPQADNDPPTVVLGAGPHPRRLIDNFDITGQEPTGELRGASRHFAARGLNRAEGSSDNQCVTVTLDLASAHGSMAVDSGWLANASAGSIAAAITQAYLAAYREQDRS
jgi:hypothetical protein